MIFKMMARSIPFDMLPLMLTGKAKPVSIRGKFNVKESKVSNS